ncbi:MAG: flagellar basal body P-ring formation chaperone FlgA [bacterium]
MPLASRLVSIVALAACLAWCERAAAAAGDGAHPAPASLDAHAQVARWIADRLQVPAELIRVDGFELPFGVPPSETLEILEDGSGAMVGALTLRARVAGPDGHARLLSLRGRVALRRERLRAARAVPRGHVIEPEDVVADLVWDDGGQPLPVAEDVIGLEARRAIPANQPLRAADVGEPTLVKRGQPLKVDYLTPGLTVVGTGRALGDGRRGELVRVEMPGARRVITTKVIGEGWVRASPDAQPMLVGRNR